MNELTLISHESLCRSEQIVMEYFDVGRDKLLQMPWKIGENEQKVNFYYQFVDIPYIEFGVIQIQSLKSIISSLECNRVTSLQIQ